jgi:formiminotetrahydrofolate cyclodeaminase
LGFALIHKGAIISLNRFSSDSSGREELADLCSRFPSAIDSIGSLADADSHAYQDYLTARALPHDNEIEQSHCTTSMEDSLLRATQIPLTAAREMCRALEFAETALRFSARHLLTDIFAGALLLEASAKAVLLCIDANLYGISDVPIREALIEERAKLERAAIALGESVAQTYQIRASVSKGDKVTGR